jgi:signal transduction histidine kinase
MRSKSLCKLANPATSEHHTRTGRCDNAFRFGIHKGGRKPRLFTTAAPGFGKVERGSLFQRRRPDEFQGINESGRIKVIPEGDAAGLWDPTRMGQVLSNLIGNAFHYSDASSPVTVSVSGTDAETVNVNVHNFGTPIPAENQTTIFQSWMRGQEVKGSGEHGSHLGLGLYIARLIVEAHGGKIAVTSDEKKGTNFTVQLPRA